MYAIIKTGGKQYKVTPECVLDVEKLDLEAGKPVKFEEVLAIGEEGGQLKVGTPLLTGAVVEGEVVEQFRAEKVWAFKMKPRTYRLSQPSKLPSPRYRSILRRPIISS